MHNGFVNKDDKKMAKSDNNFFTIRDVSEHMAPFSLVL
jgi:cysteinyl-tRNA synthetase